MPRRSAAPASRAVDYRSKEIDEHPREIAGLADRIVVPRGRTGPSEEERPRMLSIAGEQHGGDVSVPVKLAAGRGTHSPRSRQVSPFGLVATFVPSCDS